MKTPDHTDSAPVRSDADQRKAEVCARLEALMKPNPKAGLRYAAKLPEKRRKAFVKRLKGTCW